MEAIRSSGARIHSPQAALFGSAQLVRPSRCVVVVAHPNDEVVGCACLMSKLPDLRVLHVSDGPPLVLEGARDITCETPLTCAESRKRECLTALELANIPPERVVELGYQQFQAPFRMVEITQNLLNYMQQISPQILLTHAYEGGHPDHDAVAFATHCATRLLLKSGIRPATIFEMAIRPGDNGMIRVLEFLHSRAGESTTLLLDQKRRNLKRQMFECFKSQRSIMEKSPLGPERFRTAPEYDFCLPPHPGKLHYEKFGWGMSGSEWRALATEALARLFHENKCKG